MLIQSQSILLLWRNKGFQFLKLAVLLVIDRGLWEAGGCSCFFTLYVSLSFHTHLFHTPGISTRSMWGVLVAQLVSRHSCVADRLPVVVRFPAGPRVSLKWWPAERQRAPTKKKISTRSMCVGACYACTASHCHLWDPGWGDPGFRHCDFFALAPIGPSGVVCVSFLVVFNGWPARYLAHKLPCQQLFTTACYDASIPLTFSVCLGSAVGCVFFGFGCLVFGFVVCVCLLVFLDISGTSSYGFGTTCTGS